MGNPRGEAERGLRATQWGSFMENYSRGSHCMAPSPAGKLDTMKGKSVQKEFPFLLTTSPPSVPPGAEEASSLSGRKPGRTAIVGPVFIPQDSLRDSAEDLFLEQFS